MSAELFTACERLLSATANGVYQGVVVTAVAGLALRLFARTNAATRHAVWFGVLLFVTALIPAHLLLSWRSRPEITAATDLRASGMMAAALPPSNSGSAVDLPVNDMFFPDPQSEQIDAGGIDGKPYLPGESETGETASKWHPGAVATEKAIRLPHSVCLCVVFAWVFLASVRAGLIVGRIGEVRRVKTASGVPSPELQTLFERLRDSLEARRNVRLSISSTHRSAVVLGFVHPVILLPAEMDNDENKFEVEQVLRHELAHVIRRDDWGNLAQQLIQAALFFHPAVWWISARLSLEREIACDDHVLEAGGRPRAYALTLANVASRMNHCRHLLAPGVSNNNSQLQQRITMILNTHRDRSPRLARSRLGFFTAATALLAVLAINAGPRLVLAQSSADTPAASAAADSAPPAAPNAPTVDGSPAVLPPDSSAAESGPRSKPGSADDAAASVTLPESAPLALVSPAGGSVIAVVPPPPMAPVPPGPDAGPSARSMKRRMSIEERLDRIERILDDLEARNDVRGHRHNNDGFEFDEGAKHLDAPGGMPMALKFDDALTRSSEQAQRAEEEAQRALEQGQRALEQRQRAAEKAARDFEERSKSFTLSQEDMQVRSKHADDELKALRDARESLSREVESLSRQIKRLEDQQNKPKKENTAPDNAP